MALTDFIRSFSLSLTRVLPVLCLATVPGLVLSQTQPQPREQGAESQDEQGAGAGIGEPGLVERSFNQSGLGAAALAQHYPHLTVWLEPEDSPRALALFEKETSAEADGAVVVLSDEGQTANDGLLEGLRQRLTGAGWATMTLGLEAPSIAVQRARKQTAVTHDDRGGEPPEDGQAGQSVIDVNEKAAADLLDNRRQAMNARHQAAVDWLTGQGYGKIVLVGVGRGADAVRQYLPDAPVSVRQAVWINGDFGSLTPTRIVEPLARLKGLTILDLYSSRQNGADERQAAFIRNGIRGYRAMAVAMDARPQPRASGPIANRMIGWLQPRSR